MDIDLLGSSGFAAVAVFSLMLQYGGGSQAASLKAKQFVEAKVALIEAAPKHATSTLNPEMRQLLSAMPDDFRSSAPEAIITPASLSISASAPQAILTSVPETSFRSEPPMRQCAVAGTQLTPLANQILATITGEMLQSNSSAHLIDNNPSPVAVADIAVPITMPDAYFVASAIDVRVEKLASELAGEQVRVLATFTTPRITGFLKPAGFERESWQNVSNEPVVGIPLSAEPRFVIMLDPGHGGTDPGAEAHNGLVEKELTLDIARRARLFLSEFPEFNVLLTRDHDHGLSRQSRVNAIARSKADVVVSLHFNHLPQTDITLVESYYAGRENIAESLATRGKPQKRVAGKPTLDLSFTKGSERLAHTLQQRVFSEVSLDNPTAANAGVKKETLFVLTRSFTPGVLIELTPLSNVDEAEKLKTEEYRNRLAAALVDGIRMYKKSLELAPLDTNTDIGA